jgi:hypothetical protein
VCRFVADTKRNSTTMTTTRVETNHLNGKVRYSPPLRLCGIPNRIPSVYFKAGTEKIKSQREVKKQTSRLGNRAGQASSYKALVSGILTICFFSDGVGNIQQFQLSTGRHVFQVFRLVCARSAAIGRDSDLTLVWRE